ncbi:four-helix bundle copper-binding protein [Zavarzinella formosa]|uniref:four-helix bundle copper-binding protein n=1 Tax=Zavarzinella formosa TaxID=360055 RepID=UPI000381F5C5|nr:four-helix bundle copper-binding protein [Zavarzinella formosa]
MTRFLSVLTVAFTLAMSPLAATARAEDHEMKHAEHFMQCAKACVDCQLQCDMCFKHCLMLLTEGKKEHAKTAQNCVDCAEHCKLAGSLSARMSPFASFACEGCAKSCDECATACEKFPDDKHMAACAKSCRDCAKACREMSKHTMASK